MIIWIVILITGVVFTVIGFGIFFKNVVTFKKRKSVFLIGIFLPIILAYSYSETLIKDFPVNVTLIDLGGLLILGIISGVFISSYFLIRKFKSSRTKYLDITTNNKPV